MCSKAAFAGAEKIRKNVSLIVLLVFVSIFAPGCPTSPPAVTNEIMREYVHKNGLTVRLPEKFTAIETAKGFKIEPADGSNKNVRFPVEVSVALHNVGEATMGESSRQKTFGARTIKYQIEKPGGGSGGEEYILSAYEPAANGYISYEQREQNETSEPQFNLCWTIIENTSVKK